LGEDVYDAPNHPSRGQLASHRYEETGRTPSPYLSKKSGSFTLPLCLSRYLFTVFDSSKSNSYYLFLVRIG
jgi:hypothetical protein